MNWTVVWLPDAEAELADLWLASDDREALTNAANQIDNLLKIAPESIGESRGDSRRIFIMRPLAVTYRVVPDDRLVQVSNVREI